MFECRRIYPFTQKMLHIMQKLIITVTCDSSLSYPRNPYCAKPTETSAIAQAYVQAVDAKASICHTHHLHQ